MRNISYNSKDRGSIILFALVFMMVIISIGVSLLNSFLSKLLLVSDARNSVAAIYAADSATELCLYEARKQPVSINSRTVPSGAPAGYSSILNNGTSFFITRTSPLPLANVTSDCRPLGGVEGANPFWFKATGHYKGVNRTFEISQ